MEIETFSKIMESNGSLAKSVCVKCLSIYTFTLGIISLQILSPIPHATT